MTEEREEERTPLEALEKIREKIGRGEQPSAEEREFLESEGVKLDPEEGDARPVS